VIGEVVPMRDSWAASDACTLPTAERPLRVAEFDALFADHVVTVGRDAPTQVTLLLHGDRDLEGRVRDLAARETDCCSFFTFTVTAWQEDTRRVRVEIHVPPDRSQILAALASRAEESSVARRS
jgi:hypothetical protein